MSAPTLKRVKAVIGYTSSDKYSMEVGYSSHNNKHLPPHVPLLDAFEELSRILHLFGHGEEAMQRAKDAADRVAAWRNAA